MCIYRLHTRAAAHSHAMARLLRLLRLVRTISRNEETSLESGVESERRGERVLGVIRNLNYTEYYSICGYLKPQPTICQNNKI